MKKKKYVEILRTLPMIVAITCLVIECSSCTSDQNQKTMDEYKVTVSKIMPDDYHSLFKSEVQNKLRLIATYEKKNKYPTSNFLYNGEYFIQLYKLSDNYNLPLKNSLYESHNENEPQGGVPFYGNQLSLMDILDRIVTEKKITPSKIFISLYGETPRMVSKNDSLVDYYLEFRNLSIKYNINGPQEIFAQVRRSSKTIPLEILFIKKNKKLYLLFMSPKEHIRLYPQSLYNLITK